MRRARTGEARGIVGKRLLRVLGLAALGLLLASCAPHASQDTLKPAGPYAQEIKTLFVPVFWVAVGVFVIVEGGIVLILIRFRHRKHQEGPPPHACYVPLCRYVRVAGEAYAVAVVERLDVVLQHVLVLCSVSNRYCRKFLHH